MQIVVFAVLKCLYVCGKITKYRAYKFINLETILLNKGY